MKLGLVEVKQGRSGWRLREPDDPHGEDDGEDVDDAREKKRRQDASAEQIWQAGHLFISGESFLTCC